MKKGLKLKQHEHFEAGRSLEFLKAWFICDSYEMSDMLVSAEHEQKAHAETPKWNFNILCKSSMTVA